MGLASLQQVKNNQAFAGNVRGTSATFGMIKGDDQLHYTSV